MGNIPTPTVNLVNQDQMRLSYFSVQMSSSDRFRLILAPDEVKQATRNVLHSTWPIKDENHQIGFVEFKLQGSPWYNYGEKDLAVKYFLCSLIKSYYQIGWHLKASTDLERNSSETDVLFFQKLEPVDTSVICLSLNSSDKIRILSPENLYEMIRNCVLNGWPKGIQRERMFGLSYEIKLFGNPWTDWSRDSSDSYNVPILVLEIMRNLFKNGWLFVAAIDSGSLNALYFRYAPDQITKMDMENTRFFALTLNKSNRIRLHQSDQDLNALVSNQSYGIHSLWPRGIQNEWMINHALEFKLSGNPWDSHASEAVESRLLLNNLFNLFARYGWNLYATCDLTKHVTNKSTFFFRTKPIEPKSLVNFCLSLNESDKIRLINGDFGLASDVKEAVLNGWHKGIQQESDYFGSYQIKLNGNPFSAFGSDKVYTCAMMTLVLSNLERRGFKLLCSADVSQKYYSVSDNLSQPGSIANQNYYPVDLHTWFFEN